MCNFKKCMGLLLVLSVLTGLLLPAAAQSYPKMEVNTDQLVITDASGAEEIFEFIPVQDGLYMYEYHYPEYSVTPYLAVLDQNMEEIACQYGGPSLYVELEAGQRYYLKSWDTYSYPGAYYLRIERVPDASVIYVYDPVVRGLPGDENLLLSYGIRGDEWLQEPLEWSVADPSIATVYEGFVSMLSVGTTTVTASTSYGVYAHWMIHVMEIPELTCTEAVTVEATGENKYFYFTPQEDGWYSFFSSDCPGLRPHVSLCDSQGYYVESASEDERTGHFLMNCRLTAGERYELDIQCGRPSENNTYRLHVRPMEDAKTLALSDKSLSGKVEDTVQLSALLQPVNSFLQEVTWTSSNEAVVTIENQWSDEWSGHGCQLNYVNPGSATITATTESGLRATCQVTVEDYAVVTCDAAVTVDPVQGETVYAFVPDEDGWYGFYTTGGDTKGILYDGDFEQIAEADSGAQGDNFLLVTELTAGETYYIETCCETTCQLQAGKAVEPTAMTLTYEAVTVYPETMPYEIVPRFFPLLSIPQEVTWTSSDPGVVRIIDNDYWPVYPGSATLTATTESGLTAQCQMDVVLPRPITVGEKLTVVSSEKTERFTFTPETDGVYFFVSSGAPKNVSLRGSIEDPYWSTLEEVGEPDFRVWWLMDAGETYELTTEVLQDPGNVRYSIEVVPAVPATELTLDRSDMTAYMGEEGTLNFAKEPFNVWGRLTWTSSDERVAVAEDWYDTPETTGSAQVSFRLPGTCVITATTEDGCSASCTVVVREIPNVADGDTMTCQGKDGVNKFRFIPKADGEYCFESVAMAGGTGRICNSIGEILAADDAQNGDFFLSCKLKANEIYYLECEPGNAAQGSYQVCLNRKGAGQSVSGKVSSAGDEPVKLELLKDGQVVDTLTTADGSYCFENVAPGSYTLRVSVPNHVTRDYAVTTGTEPVTLEAEASLLGDVTGDGRVNIGDAARAYSHVKQTSLLSDDYRQACANVNGGSLNIGDVASLYSHIKGTKKLY